MQSAPLSNSGKQVKDIEEGKDLTVKEHITGFAKPFSHIILAGLRFDLKSMKALKKDRKECRNGTMIISEGERTKPLFRSLQDFTFLQSLRVTFDKPIWLNGKNARYLSRCLRHLPTLQHLVLKFLNCEEEDEDDGEADSDGEDYGHLAPGSGSNDDDDDDYNNKLKVDRKDLFLGRSLRKLTGLKRLEIAIVGQRGQKLKDILFLSEALVYLPSLEHLSICCKYCFTLDGLIYFERSFKRLKSLQTLELSFPNNYAHEALQYFSHSLGLLTSLKRFSLYLFENPMNFPISDEGIRQLGESLEKMTSLEYFSLTGAGYITDLGLKSLGTTLKKTISLKEIQLSFGMLVDLTKEGVQVLSEGLKSLVLLQSLTIGGDSWKINDLGIKFLAEGMESLTSLKSINLKFLTITDEEMKHFAEMKKCSKSLEKICLDFTRCRQISDTGLAFLEEGLCHLSNLKSITFGFVECSQISNKGLRHLSEVLKQADSLQYIGLYFGSCSKITDEGIIHICEALKSKASLKTIKFHLNECEQITEKELIPLAELGCLDSLVVIDFNFHRCSNLTDEGIIHICKALKSKASLRTIKLNFTQCNQIKEQGLMTLAETLGCLDSLVDIELNFARCSSVTDKIVESFGTNLKLLKSLESVLLSFYDCSSVNHEAKIALGEELKSLLPYSLKTFRIG